MKTMAQMKEEAYEQLKRTGQFESVKAQLKAFVYDYIEKQHNHGKSKNSFEYVHPQLSKIKNYPITSLSVDLVQEFLQSFKFKHTLSVFKSQINRKVTINRSQLAQSFKIEIKNPEKQSVLVSIVQQMFSGDIGAARSDVKINNFVDGARTADRTNNFINDSSKVTEKKNDPLPKAPEPSFKKPTQNNSTSNINSSNISNSNIDSSLNSNSASFTNQKVNPNDSSSVKIDTSKEESSKIQQPPKVEEDDKKKKGGKDSKKKPVIEKQKPPEGAKDLLGDVMGKFGAVIKSKDKEKEKNEIFEAKRAFSEEKQKKVVDPSESGANKIRGISMGKTVPSFMNKFMNQPPPPKNESYIDEELDEFQQSKDSTRKNPLFSSSESGFDKSGFDHSVDSNAIEDYEYIERAKKLSKKI